MLPTEHIFPEWAKNTVIYEVNLRQYTPGGSIREFIQHLPRLRDLGINMLWFMPLQPIGKVNRKGTLGSYYSISDYTEMNPEFGDMDEFRELVLASHQMGMRVILDWVANHTSWDHIWIEKYPGFYTRDTDGNIRPPFPDWEDVVKLDYANELLWKEMIKAMKFWITQSGIDGFRCDMAHLVPTGFWEAASKELRKICPDIFMLAESDHYDLLDDAFNSSYDWKTYHAMNELASGKIQVSDLAKNIEEQLEKYPPNASLLRFITNHDENSWQGSELERLGLNLEPMTILYFTIPGIPLVYSGQEAGNAVRLPFFDKSEIVWKKDKMYPVIQKLCQLRSEEPSVWSSTYGGGLIFLQTSGDNNGVLAYERRKEENGVVVILNFTGNSRRITVSLNNTIGNFRDIFNPQMNLILSDELCLDMEPYGYRVLQAVTKFH